VLSIFVLAFALYASASQRLREDVAVTDLTLARSIALETDAMLLKAKEAVAWRAFLPQALPLAKILISFIVFRLMG
jgi:hypothetical protein